MGGGQVPYFIIFSAIFLAELPDKTSWATMSLASRGRPLSVWAGSALALASQTALAIYAGQWLARFPRNWVHGMGAIAFLGFAVWYWRESREPNGGEDSVSSRATPGARLFLQAFLTVFLAEFLDITQLATVAFSTRYPDHPVTLFGIVTAALVLASGISSWAGRWVQNWVSPRRLSQLAALLFLSLGIWAAWSL